MAMSISVEDACRISSEATFNHAIFRRAVETDERETDNLAKMLGHIIGTYKSMPDFIRSSLEKSDSDFNSISREVVGGMLVDAVVPKAQAEELLEASITLGTEHFRMNYDGYWALAQAEDKFHAAEALLAAASTGQSEA
jgi:hypothetical protein